MGPLVAKYLGTVVKKKRNGRPVDSLNVASYPTAFYLTCLPVHTLRQMWIMQVFTRSMSTTPILLVCFWCFVFLFPA